MKTLIVFDSKHGTVAECAEKISAAISDCTCIKLAKPKHWPTLASYDRVIIGGSIHVGKVQKSIVDFCTINLPNLLNKQVGIFLCTMTPREEAGHYIKEQFPIQLVEHAKVVSCLGGEVRFERMGFLERLMMKKIIKSDQNIYGVSEEAIKDFVAQIL